MNRKSVAVYLLCLCICFPILSNVLIISSDNRAEIHFSKKSTVFNNANMVYSQEMEENIRDQKGDSEYIEYIENFLETDNDGNRIEDSLQDLGRFTLLDDSSTDHLQISETRILILVNISETQDFINLIEDKVLKVYSRTLLEPDLMLISCSIQNDRIIELIPIVDNNQGIFGVKLDEEIEFLMNHALLQGQIYPTLREDFGLQGDNNSAIAVIDSGVDETHPMLEGYGDKDFTKKIVGWEDFTDDNEPEPYERTEHGSFVSSVAAGNPYNSTDGMGRKLISSAVHREWSVLKGPLYLDTVLSFNVTAPGLITANGSWEKGSPSSHAEVHKICLMGPNGSVLLNTSIADENINTLVEYDAPADELGVYKVGYYFNISADIYKSFNLYTDVHYNISKTQQPLSMQGVAPNARLVVLKVRYLSDYVEAMEWLLENGTEYNITTVNMSFRISSNSVASLTEDLVENGFICVAAAGNEYGSGNYAASFSNVPGSVDKVISVGATDNRNHIASYSSAGGQSWQGGTVKPDCVAPGGEFATRTEDYLQIIAADSNDKDYISTDPDHPDRISDDLTTRAGTSFSSAFVSGVTNLIIESLGGFEKWNYSEDEVLNLKSWLLLTSTETAPNDRNGPGTNDPSLDRGEKDRHEGYGMINPDAIIEMLHNELPMNTSVTDELVATSHETKYYGKSCFARSVYLKNNHYYDFNLSLPDSADFDLYIYKSESDEYGQPQLVSSGTKASKGEDELFRFSPEESGKFFITVKAISGLGEFTLEVTDEIDKNLPSSLQIFTPTASSYYSEDILFSILFEDDETAVDNLTIHFHQLDNETQSVIHKVYPTVELDYTDEFSIDSTDYQDGYYNITCTAADRNNNKANSTSIIFCIDNTVPNNLAIINPQLDSRHYGKITVSGMASDQLSGLDYATLNLFTRTAPLCTKYEPSGLVRCEFESQVSDDGLNYVYIKAFDKAGNSATSELIQIEIINRNVNRIFGVFIILFMGVGGVAMFKLAEKILINIDLDLIFNFPQKSRALVHKIFNIGAEREEVDKDWRRINID